MQTVSIKAVITTLSHQATISPNLVVPFNIYFTPVHTVSRNAREINSFIIHLVIQQVLMSALSAFSLVPA